MKRIIFCIVIVISCLSGYAQNLYINSTLTCAQVDVTIFVEDNVCGPGIYISNPITVYPGDVLQYIFAVGGGVTPVSGTWNGWSVPPGPLVTPQIVKVVVQSQCATWATPCPFSGIIYDINEVENPVCPGSTTSQFTYSTNCPGNSCLTCTNLRGGNTATIIFTNPTATDWQIDIN